MADNSGENGIMYMISVYNTVLKSLVYTEKVYANKLGKTCVFSLSVQSGFAGSIALHFS